MKSKKLLIEFKNQKLEIKSSRMIFGGKDRDSYCDTETYDSSTRDPETCQFDPDNKKVLCDKKA